METIKKFNKKIETLKIIANDLEECEKLIDNKLGGFKIEDCKRELLKLFQNGKLKYYNDIERPIASKIPFICKVLKYFNIYYMIKQTALTTHTEIIILNKEFAKYNLEDIITILSMI